MTNSWSKGATPSPEHVPEAIVEAEGWAKVRRWALGGLEVLVVGLLVPIAILVVGTPLALVVRLAIDLIGR